MRALAVAALGGIALVLLPSPATAAPDQDCSTTTLLEPCSTSTSLDTDTTTTTGDDTSTTVDEPTSTTDEDDEPTATTRQGSGTTAEVVLETTTTLTVTTGSNLLVPGDGSEGAESTTTTSIEPVAASGDGGISDGTLIVLVIIGLVLIAGAVSVLTWRYWVATRPPLREPDAGSEPSPAHR